MKILKACLWLTILGLMILAGCDNGLEPTFSVQESKDTVSSNTSESRNAGATNGDNTSEAAKPDNNIDQPDASGDKVDGDSNEEVSKTEGTAAEDGMSYYIDIYKNPDDKANPTSVEHVTRVLGSQLPRGRHTIRLSSPVSLKKDEVFSVVVTFTTNPGQNPTVEYEENGVSLVGQSFYRIGKSGDWTDMHSCGYGNIRIKAFTKNL